MKALILDIDGVLNNTITGGVMHWNSTTPERIDLLNKIVDSTGCKIFIISSWVDDVFFEGNNKKLADFLYSRGIRENSIAGFRRDGLSKEDGTLEIIQQNEDIESFVVLDDNPDIFKNDYLKERHIKTESLQGLTEVEANKAIELLSDEKVITEISLKDRFLGCLIGLAVGDAYGTTYEFKDRSRMPTVLPDHISGGGPFNMKPGEWTDDTSMALCLAESLIENGWAPHDQMYKYTLWWQQGYNSVKGVCFDIGGATSRALSWYNMTEGKEYVQDKQAAGNGVLMRLAPVPMFFYHPDDCIYTLKRCADESAMTHPSSQSIECSMLMGAIINKILSGEKDKMKILHFDTLFDEESKKMYKEQWKHYSCITDSRIESIKKVEYKDYPLELLSGDGYCVYTLEAALWAFLTTDNFKDGLKKVVSLGSDTDTTGAVYGQIAGAYYGINNIPWVEKIAWIEKITDLAEKIYENNRVG